MPPPPRRQSVASRRFERGHSAADTADTRVSRPLIKDSISSPSSTRGAALKLFADSFAHACVAFGLTFTLSSRDAAHHHCHRFVGNAPAPPRSPIAPRNRLRFRRTPSPVRKSLRWERFRHLCRSGRRSASPPSIELPDASKCHYRAQSTDEPHLFHSATERCVIVYPPAKYAPTLNFFCVAPKYAPSASSHRRARQRNRQI